MSRARPNGVPQTATFNAADNEWQLGERQGAVQLGDWTWWRPDGTLVCKSTFDHDGKLHGVSRRFHPDGGVSLESRYVHGARWGKTWHTRSAGGGSPEDAAMARLPHDVHRFEMVYLSGKLVPHMLATLNATGRDAPPELRVGHLVDMARDLPKYQAGTAFMVIGGVTDIANRRHDVRALFFDGPALADYTVLRFAFAPPGAHTSDKPTWQDPSYGTVLSIEEARDNLFVAVDALDALIVDDQPPVKWGVRVERAGDSIQVRGLEPGGRAETSELRAGDVIVQANDRSIDSLVSYLEALRDANRTRVLTLRVSRGTVERTLTISG